MGKEKPRRPLGRTDTTCSWEYCSYNHRL